MEGRKYGYIGIFFLISLNLIGKKEFREFSLLMQNECHIPSNTKQSLGPSGGSGQGHLRPLSWPSSWVYLPPCLVPSQGRKSGGDREAPRSVLERAKQRDAVAGTRELSHCLLLPGVLERPFHLPFTFGVAPSAEPLFSVLMMLWLCEWNGRGISSAMTIA